MTLCRVGMVGCLLSCLGCLLRSFKFDTVVQMFATVLCYVPSSFLLRHRLVHLYRLTVKKRRQANC
ncbi:hypothetical protein K457DRAFT_651076 [Linnemannia elongata AG-77]|uniref:Uncharacterized protein n=1 Tax=Linnemannia elongata AG-77 TaxID=1314771 RepID=A0A197KBT5_9FUNG|nr:hypothetical protein K457DRAFT_651076 [Linnemannia elongata AG-77]